MESARARLLSGGEAGRVRQCEHHDCRLLFVDSYCGTWRRWRSVSSHDPDGGLVEISVQGLT